MKINLKKKFTFYYIYIKTDKVENKILYDVCIYILLYLY